jgi:predicted membrane protein
MKNHVFFPGLILIFIGLLFFGRNIGWIDYFLFRILFSWQTLLIVIGAGLCLRRSFVGGLVLIAVATYFLLPRINGMWIWDVQRYWPLLIVLIGIVILFKRPLEGRCRHHHHKITTDTLYTSQDGFVRSEVTFGTVKQIVVDPIFKGAEIKTTFGSTLIDLRRTSLEDPETYIDVESTFGGIELFVPNTWMVVSKANADFGGIDDKRFHSGFIEIDNSRKVIIRGKIVFGGLEIKN